MELTVPKTNLKKIKTKQNKNRTMSALGLSNYRIENKMTLQVLQMFQNFHIQTYI